MGKQEPEQCNIDELGCPPGQHCTQPTSEKLYPVPCFGSLLGLYDNILKMLASAGKELMRQQVFGRGVQDTQGSAACGFLARLASTPGGYSGWWEAQLISIYT